MSARGGVRFREQYRLLKSGFGAALIQRPPP
jgi:hypothetical protein